MLSNNKRKTSDDNELTKRIKESESVEEEVIQAVWSHYRNYIESEEKSDEENEPDFDELHEIVSLLDSCVGTNINEVNIKSLSIPKPSSVSLPNIESLLPVLLSVVYLHLGDYAISRGFEEEEEDENENENEQNNAETLLRKSLAYYPMNAASLSMLANYQRTTFNAPLDDICETYKLASSCAKMIRDFALSAMMAESCSVGDDKMETTNTYEEWIELLLLNGIAGVQFIGEDDEEGDDDEEDEGRESEEANEDSEFKEANDEDENVDQEGPIDEYSSSEVQATSSFMAALLQSTLKKHDDALNYLAKFNFTHRIHPNVWLAATQPLLKNKEELIKSDASLSFQPRSFSGGVLPQHLYEQLCETFSPSAAFWSESDYQNRGYFSFFEDIIDVDKTNKPKNLIDDVVVNHLLPLAKLAVPSETIVGYEWWAHTRALEANLGHQLHFDTDEALLAQEQKVTHPVVSSVLYLTGNKSKEETTAGSTIIFNQTPDSTTVASEVYVSQAEDEKYMIFPGNCLHGVLPCSGKGNSDSDPTTGIDDDTPVQRLTLMFGFWTRRVPDKMENRHLYGPCGPLPAEDDENSWVSQICEGGIYKDSYQLENELGKKHGSSKITSVTLPTVNPAWEDISYHVKKDEDDLEIPRSLDHRFFVKNASSCFRDSLFKDKSFRSS